ncbi:glycosyltransferase, group 2 family protein [Paenibacillus sp. oral taxon 786 str. D14]|uniref:glycosyltransferase n=1 Tax=Paenibacillus sp. oral taxon 786 TaxID=652715 RepID=UPI0001AFD862|nr:glycosyltransferase [Paenibacillus sp. oral taxon 786]EES72749.1 glycosyltransferase, group 2 family protein [Paenibacillus sp. oral taxon 786 str. D14]
MDKININEKEEELKKLQGLLNKLNSNIKHELEKENILKNQLRLLESQVVRLQEEYEKSEQVKKNELEKLQQLKNSHSWKITAPLRYMSFFIRNNKRKKDFEYTSLPNNYVKILKQKLYSYGFEAEAVQELWGIFTNDNYNLKLKLKAAWELFVWHGGQGTKEDAEKALSILPFVLNNTSKEDTIKKATIIEVECLKILGRIHEAKKKVQFLMALDAKDMNSLLAAANLEDDPTLKLSWINKVLVQNNYSKVTLIEDENENSFNSLKSFNNNYQYSNRKISVIMPTYCAEKVIRTSIESILNQTWKNLELIVVDDCSTDNTVSIVKEYASIDNRVILIRAETNSGTYVARNLGLKIATGEFVTCQDADDWAHPQKLEKQILHLIDNPSVLGNTSETSRITENLDFVRKGKVGCYISNNFSSLMFRRCEILSSVGYWDSVRFGADSEFIRRIRKVHGDKSIVNLKTCILSLSRVSSGSLTDNGYFGFNGFFYGARKEYFDSFNRFHKSSTKLKYEFPQINRPFPVPNPLMPERGNLNEYRTFDIVIASDFRDENEYLLGMIQKMSNEGVNIGIIQVYYYDYNSTNSNICDSIRNLIDHGNVQMLVYGERISCKHLIIGNSLLFQHNQKYIPSMQVNKISVLVTEEIFSRKISINEIEICIKKVTNHFGNSCQLCPVNQNVKEKFQKYYGGKIKLGEDILL